MRISCDPDETRAGTLLAAPVGQLDFAAADRFWEAVCERLTDNTPSLIIDMTGVDILTSAGVGVLIRLQNHVEPRGGQLALFGCNQAVHRVLSVCELEDLLKVSPSIEKARQRVSG